ncbi:hypothetical protein, conserved [Eimeria brunetti]|uniref:Uncharacterized protein n=1 Tax=Eimeria brunetti TaxID=51314 RepID=U6LNG2_9EIME|nr:hypothetical protein, conserved [Eimeria brunetti]
MGDLLSLLPSWAFFLSALIASAGRHHVGALAEGPSGGPLAEAAVRVAQEAATTSKEDVLMPEPATRGYRWCAALDLDSDKGACSSSSSSGSSNVLPQALDDGCFGLVLLLLLLLAADHSGGLLRRVWDPLCCLARRMRFSSSDSNTNSSNRFAAAAETEEGRKLLGELASLQQQLVKEQTEQQQLSATAEFAAYARKQRKVDQLASARDSCIEKLQKLQEEQQPQHQRTKKDMLLLLQAASQLLLKPLLKRHGSAAAKLLFCWIIFALVDAQVALPTAQLTPLNLLGPRCPVVFPFVFMICRMFLNEKVIADERVEESEPDEHQQQQQQQQGISPRAAVAAAAVTAAAVAFPSITTDLTGGTERLCNGCRIVPAALPILNIE